MNPGFYICDANLNRYGLRPILEPAIRENLLALLSAAAYMAAPRSDKADIASESANAAENVEKVVDAIFNSYFYTDAMRKAISDYAAAWGPAAASELDPEKIRDRIRAIIFSRPNIEYYVEVTRAVHEAGAPLSQVASAIFARIEKPLDKLKYTLSSKLRGVKREQAEILGDDELDTLTGDSDVDVTYHGPAVQDPRIYDAVDTQVRKFKKDHPGMNLDTDAVSADIVDAVGAYALETFPDQYQTLDDFQADMKFFLTTR